MNTILSWSSLFILLVSVLLFILALIQKSTLAQLNFGVGALALFMLGGTIAYFTMFIKNPSPL